MKKRMLFILFSIICIFIFSACKIESGGDLPGSEEDVLPSSTISQTENPSKNEKVSEIYITVNGHKLTVALEENTSVDALVEILRDGDISYLARDYGGFEKVGDIGHELPANHAQLSAKSGDVILYRNSEITIFYGNNSWSYTRIGRIEGYSSAELRNILGGSDVDVTIGLE